MTFACARRERLGLPVVERNVEENLDVLEAVERAEERSADYKKPDGCSVQPFERATSKTPASIEPRSLPSCTDRQQQHSTRTEYNKMPLFGPSKTPAERMEEKERMQEKEKERQMKKQAREKDRERTGLERREKQLMADIKKEAKAGQNESAKIKARELVRTPPAN